jgi:addiction module RelE/StbE family toxin
MTTTKTKTKALRIEFSDVFNKRLSAAPRHIIAIFAEVIHLFRENPYHPALRNHPLKKKYAGYRSIDVTEDWRAVFKETESSEYTLINFRTIGTHEYLYGLD